jgi:hypothetical protein
LEAKKGQQRRTAKLPMVAQPQTAAKLPMEGQPLKAALAEKV